MNPQRIDAFMDLALKEQKLLQDIFICVPVRPHDGIALGLHTMLNTWTMVGIMSSPLDSGMAGFIDVTRMKIVYDFLHNRTQKYLLMIDNDTEPVLELPYLLARHDQPIVGSCIPSMNREGRMMLCFSRPDRTGLPRFIDFEENQKIPATGLAETPHCGTGAMLIRRDVLESFTYQKQALCESCGHSEWDVPFLVSDDVKARGMVHGLMIEGEDIKFCKQARAKGYKIHVDLEAHCGHRKSVRLTFPELLRDPSMKVDDWVSPDEGMGLSRD